MAGKKVALYSRVSSDEQAQGDKFSIKTQIADCERHCQQHADNVVKHYVDIQSGRDAQKDREQFEQMLKDAKLGLFDKIVVWRPDRLFRGLTPAAKLAKVLDETAVEIEGVLQPLNRNMIGLWAWVAEQEIEAMKERLGQQKRANARELGKWGGGLIKYGYKYNSNKKSPDYTGKLEKDEEEASIVTGLFQWVDSGKKASSWCKWANEQGIPTKRNSQGWTPQEVSELLRSECYTGKGAYGKLTRKNNRLVPADNPVAMQYPRIIADDLFQRVQGRLRENKRKNNAGAKQPYMLQHLGRCGVCGGRLCCTTNGIMEYRYIYCLNQRRFPNIYKCFKPQNWHMSGIENYVWGEVADTLDAYKDKTYDLWLDKFEAAKSDTDGKIARAKGEIARCKQERQRVLTQVRKGGYVTEDEAKPQFKVIREEQEYWEQELCGLESIKVNGDEVWNRFWPQIKRVQSMFDYGFITATPEQKKEILNLLLEEFKLYDGKIELRLKLPVNEEQMADTFLTQSRNDTSFGNFYYESMRLVATSTQRV